MKKEIIAMCALSAAALCAGCSEQGDTKASDAQPATVQKIDEPKRPYRRSVPPPVTADEFNKAGMRGAGSNAPEGK